MKKAKTTKRCSDVVTDRLRKKFISMKLLKYVFLWLLFTNWLFVNSIYANENVFELIAPSSYLPVNLLTEFDVIDSGSYQLNLSQNIKSIFPDHEISQATLYLVMPGVCVMSEASTDYKVHHRMDYNYYAFNVMADQNMLIDVSMDIRTSAINAKDFGLIIVARDNQGNDLVHDRHDNNMHKEIIMQKYMTGLPNAPVNDAQR